VYRGAVTMPAALRRTACGLGVAVATIGALVVLGWAIDVVIIPSGVDDFDALRANAGLALLLGGAALVLVAIGSRGWLARSLASGVLAIGLLTVGEYVFGVDLGIDELLFAAEPPDTGTHPARIAPNAAGAFSFVGGALLLLAVDRAPRTRDLLALVALTIGVLGLVGHLADLPALLTVGSLNRIALPAACCFVALGAGAAIADPSRGLGALIASDGPAGPLLRRLLPTAFLVPLGATAILRLLREADVIAPGAEILLILGITMLSMLAVVLSFGRWLDLAERRRAQESEGRRAEQERRRAIFDNARDAIVTADDAGRIVEFNPAAERMFGRAVAQAAGEPLTILMPERFRAAHEGGLARFIATGETRVIGRTVELIGRRADESEFPLSLSLSTFVVDGERFFSGVLADISERQRGEAELRRSRALLDRSQQLARLGSWVWDIPSDTVTWSNELHRLYGTSPEEFEASYEAFLDHVHPDDRERVDAIVTRAYQTGGSFDFDHRTVRPDGEVFVMHAHGEVMLDEAGNAIKMEGTGQDVTQRRHDDEELARRAAALARSNADLEQFAYVASHDLSEPLRTISGFSELLERRHGERLDGEALEFLGSIIGGTARMKRLIDDLLAYSQAGSGEMRPERVDVARLVADVTSGLEATIAAAGVELEVSELPVVRGDRAQLARVFQNLISNAVKFRAGEHPRIWISAERDGADWRFEVADNGIGIEPRFAERVFGMFQRLHGREEYEGTGIGLPLCRRIVERYGGRIWIEARPGGGTALRFTLAGSQVEPQAADGRALTRR